MNTTAAPLTGACEIGLQAPASRQLLENLPVADASAPILAVAASSKPHSPRNRSARLLIVCLCSALALTAGCSASSTVTGTKSSLPSDPPPAANVVSLDPHDWYILYSNGTPPHPSVDPQGAWSIQLPDVGTISGNPAHLGYVETPFVATTSPHSVTVVFQVFANAAQYQLLGDTLPPTCHLFFEQKNDDLVNPNGRWWAPSSIYNLPSQNGDVIVTTIPLTPDQWTNVNGQHDAAAFSAALANVGWFGFTFGGQSYAGHGVAVGSGASKFVLINYVVN